jgi:hypothetical protein
MLGAILAGVVLGAATLIILKGRKGPRAIPVRVKTKDKNHAQDR